MPKSLISLSERLRHLDLDLIYFSYFKSNFLNKLEQYLSNSTAQFKNQSESEIESVMSNFLLHGR